MLTARVIIYTIWFLFPLFFFAIALWSGLESMRSNRGRHENPGDYFKQGLFVLACVLVSIIIDQFALEWLVNLVASEWLPLEFFQVILLPIILLVAAKYVGGSKKIRIGEKSK